MIPIGTVKFDMAFSTANFNSANLRWKQKWKLGRFSL